MCVKKILFLYHMVYIKGKEYALRMGSRAQVMHGTAYMTAGKLTKDKLMLNKNGRIVSRKMSQQGAKLLKRLTDAGYLPFKKGESTVRRRR